MAQRALLESLLDEARELRVDRGRAVRLCETVLGVAEGRYPATAARAWRILGHTRLYDSDWDRADEAYGASLRRAEDLGNGELATHARLGLGETAQRRGDLLAAQRLFGEALALAPEDFPSTWLIHNHLGNVLNGLGDREAALQHYERCREEMDERTPARKAAVVLGNIGVIHALRGDLGEALGWFESAQRQWARTTPVAGTATNLGNLGKLHCLLGQPEQGIPLLARAIRMMADMGYLDGQMEEYTKLAECLEHLGNTDGAIEAYRQALELAHPLEMRRGEVIVRSALARLLEDPVEAADHARIRDRLRSELGQKPSAPT